jgi:hypothetical protein
MIESPRPAGALAGEDGRLPFTRGESGGNEILSYEWHANVLVSVSFSHLHLRYGTGLGRSKFGRAHLPTGRITLEGFVRLLVGDFAVPRPATTGKRPWSRVTGSSSRALLGSPAIGLCCYEAGRGRVTGKGPMREGYEAPPSDSTP